MKVKGPLEAHPGSPKGLEWQKMTKILAFLIVFFVQFLRSAEFSVQLLSPDARETSWEKKRWLRTVEGPSRKLKRAQNSQKSPTSWYF